MLTQERLGERAGVTGKLVGQIERGDGNPTLEVIVGLAGALEVAPSSLMLFEDEPAAERPSPAASALGVAEEVTRYLARLPADEVERARRILEAAFGEVK
jgi:transcriptional regulator with XRE-family HTH domain